jgi:hypothetical protein
MILSTYSDKSFVITGNTKEYKDELKEMGGRWNSKLTCGSGWIFSLTKKKDLESWLQTKQIGIQPVTTQHQPVKKSEGSILDEFVNYLEPFYENNMNLKDILYDFAHHRMKDDDSTIVNDTTQLYNHYYTFFSLRRIDHKEYQLIDKDKFIEHALIRLL